jgi:hypothetical protein
MRGPAVIAALVLALSAYSANAFYLPGVAPMDFRKVRMNCLVRLDILWPPANALPPSSMLDIMLSMPLGLVERLDGPEGQ